MLRTNSTSPSSEDNSQGLIPLFSANEEDILASSTLANQNLNRAIGASPTISSLPIELICKVFEHYHGTRAACEAVCLGLTCRRFYVILKHFWPLPISTRSGDPILAMSMWHWGLQYHISNFLGSAYRRSYEVRPNIIVPLPHRGQKNRRGDQGHLSDFRRSNFSGCMYLYIAPPFLLRSVYGEYPYNGKVGTKEEKLNGRYYDWHLDHSIKFPWPYNLGEEWYESAFKAIEKRMRNFTKSERQAHERQVPGSRREYTVHHIHRLDAYKRYRKLDDEWLEALESGQR